MKFSKGQHISFVKGQGAPCGLRFVCGDRPQFEKEIHGNLSLSTFARDALRGLQTSLQQKERLICQ